MLWQVAALIRERNLKSQGTKGSKFFELKLQLEMLLQVADGSVITDDQTITHRVEKKCNGGRKVHIEEYNYIGISR